MSKPAKLTDRQLLAAVGAERLASVGFDHDKILSAARDKALEYSKGVMTDMAALPNRSAVTSSDVADAIETILPDLVEIFTGDDVATFQPQGPEDGDSAQQETDYVNHVFFAENNGWLVLYTMFKDACQVKTGVAKTWWEDGDDTVELFTGKTREEVALAMQAGEVTKLRPSGEDEPDEEIDPDAVQDGDLFDFTLTQENEGRPRVEAVAPEDFTVAADTTRLQDTTYAAHRSRPRAQQLIADGIDADLIDRLTAHGRDTEQAQFARDTAGEGNQSTADNIANLHAVEVIDHYIRIDADGDGKPELWRVMTGADESVMLEKERVNRIPFAAITPYIVTHRFYGESVADKLLEIQRINTSLTRMALDSGYFALNQRFEVADEGSNDFTISDLLDNTPGAPVRVKTMGTVGPLSSGGLGFDPFSALEYFATKAEQRTGVVRNAQGLNPDTLHDTAKGAMALLSAAQKRVRLIARIFAETGVKDLFLLLHGLLREHASKAATVRLRGTWQAVDPSSWGERNDMEIEIGVGSSGREHDLAMLGQVITFQTQAIGEQGGIYGPLVTGPNLYAAVKRYCERGGIKNPEKYFTDPATVQQPQPGPPPPDPKAIEAQGKLQLAQQTAMAQHQLDQQKSAQAADLDRQKAEQDLQQKRDQAMLDAQIARERHDLEMQLKRDTAGAELQLRREQIQAQIALQEQAAARDHEFRMATARPPSVGQPVEIGGAPG